MFLSRLSAVLLLALSATPAQPQRPANDPIRLLDRVADHYAEAKSFHLEAIVHNRSHGELNDFSSTSILSAYVAPGNRFRYDGKTAEGSSLIVSDGASEWHLMRSFGRYSKQPAGTYFRGTSLWGGDDSAIKEAEHLLSDIVAIKEKVDLARFLPPEPLLIDGNTVRCTVVQFEYAPVVERDPAEPIVYHHTAWINPDALTVVRLETRSHYQPRQGVLAPPYAQFTDHVDTTTFSVADLNFQPKPETFTFAAPAGSIEVAKLPTLYPPPGTEPDSRAADYIGKPLPQVVLRDAAGAEVPLSRFRGHPLLIDIWATWCGPCMNDLPALGKIRSSTAATDLQIIGIDEDYKPATALNLLKQRGYDWPNFHLTAAAQKQLSVVEGVPLVILTDATGKIVYYYTGGGNSKALAEAIAKLGKQYKGVRTD